MRDYRGGGRSSARETAARVAAGAIARKVLAGVNIRGALVQMGTVAPSTAPAAGTGTRSARTLLLPRSARPPRSPKATSTSIRKAGSSIGAVLEIVAEGVPPGLGRADLRQARRRARGGAHDDQRGQGGRDRRRLRRGRLSGEDNADEMRAGNHGAPVFLSNHAGGVLGGISTGQPVVARFAVKPTSSILSPRRTVTRPRGDRDRHQGPPRPCVGIRAVPVGEAMVACVLADAFLRHRGQVGGACHGPSRSPDGRYRH